MADPRTKKWGRWVEQGTNDGVIALAMAAEVVEGQPPPARLLGWI